jgi:hypothetical protein
MKMKKVTISTLLITIISCIGWLFISCDQFKTLPDDFEDALDLKINADLKLTFGSISIVDASDEQLITAPVSVAFRKDAKDSAMLVSIEGKKVDTAKFTGGIFQFALNKGYTPPINLPVTVWSVGYDTFYTVITFSQAQQQQFTFALRKKDSGAKGIDGGPVGGVGVKDTVLGVIGADSKVATKIDLSIATSRAEEITPTTPISDLAATVSIPQGTILYNKKGEPLQGEIVAKSAYFDVSNPDAFANLPGSRLAVAPGADPNSPMAISALGGIPVQVSGVPGGSGVEQTSFISAGLLSLDLSVNGVTVDSFSQPLTVKMEMDASIINPKTGDAIKDGDTIDLWSIDKNGTTWQWEGKVVVQGPAVDGKLSATFLIKHLSYWNLDWHFSAVCYYDTLKVTGVPANINLYVQPSIIYPSGQEANYYNRQLMDGGSAATRSMIFMNVPKGYRLKFRFYTALYGVEAFQDTVAITDNCAPMGVTCPSGLVSDQLKLNVIATDSAGVPVGPQWLYLYGTVQGSSQSFSVYSQNDTFNIDVSSSATTILSIYSNGALVGTKTINGKTDTAITAGVVRIPVDIPAKCTFKVAIKGAITGSYLYLNAILDSKGAYPRTYNQYFYINKADTTLVFDQFPKDRYVKFSLYAVYGVQLPVVNNLELLMNSMFCGQSIAIDLKSFYSRPKVVLHNTATGSTPVNVAIRTYLPSVPGSTIPGSTPYQLFIRTNTTDTVFYPEALPAQWPVEIIVTGTQYDSCALSSVIEVGRMAAKIIDTSYSNWNKSVTVNFDGSKVLTPGMVKIPVNISIRCTKMEITPSITFYYRPDCPSQRWNTGYLSMGKTVLYLVKGQSYVFAIYDPKTGALKSGKMTVTEDLIIRANASANGVNLYDEVTSPEVRDVLDGFCSRMTD